MKLSVDGGGLCAGAGERYGNYTFTVNFLEALKRYDTVNNYSVYTFCNARTANTKNIHVKKILPSSLWMKLRVPLEEYIRPTDYFLALNQAIPLFTPAKIISISHGLSFEKFPEYYPQVGYFKSQLRGMLRRSQHVIVSSSRVQEEMQSSKVTVLPFGIPFDMMEGKKEKREKYFLYVGMNSPIKNLDFLAKQFENYKLYIVGCDYKSQYRSIINIPVITRRKLRELYRQASAYVTTSLYESFNFPVVEALSQNCPVIGLSSALIPEVQPFCTVVRNEQDFVKNLKHALEKKQEIDRKKLQKIFSWKAFINGLTMLY